ncbi:hypothetical protein F9C07_10440 [Aspergillus flavus]|uniref:Uncharacterized protein n=3 Tax=Aspergillus subgen. Circumdati TaxID=2720871 RepID=B8NQZ0_ASPFN|nr:uncharacterized protein G4B84_007100 [Aspergillus flavus NRRL3357]EIT77125.1 hypothetical protein Ao3042_06582 [Aspergillus oryzae 3.042]KAB8253173.1 hypothetical protein BDV35DRAFT_131165 [Aspergillus flavus]KDE78626.1 hypothetical protein AO1008_05006 [Aspergillus oryzae 100-8]KOC17652.1 hypothetical protein AFLA70_406g000650 [Aspergillus flavus AF70]KAF7621395.1 hypothetical protein AFLA_011698 [Aspergillus flavus NRRL3357]|eukprot:EIT77125.1 hypothetical protein Ao3042_06582 [Aspergillus oryzae 3.042]
MRLSIRVGTAALLILAIFLIKRHIDTVQDDSRVPLSSFWRFGGSSAGSDSGNQGAPVDKTAMESDVISPQNYETTPIIVPNDRALVMAKLASEDTSWVANDLNEWRNVIYTVDDLSATRHTPINKGRESLAYLQYIIEHYHDLPSLIVFIHSHKDGWPAAWHTDNMEYSNVVAIRNLQADFVQQNGYANLRCQETPGCPEELRPLRNPPRPGQTTEAAYAQAWKELFNNTEVPEVIGAPCCSQFAVSRDQVLKRSFEEYMQYYNWVLTNDLPDDVTSRVMEYSWHIIFGKDPVYCPDSLQCYADVYGNPYFW